MQKKIALTDLISLNFTIIWCLALVKQLKSREDKKGAKSGQKVGLGCLCRPVLPNSSFTSFAWTPIC